MYIEDMCGSVTFSCSLREGQGHIDDNDDALIIKIIASSFAEYFLRVRPCDMSIFKKNRPCDMSVLKKNCLFYLF